MIALYVHCAFSGSPRVFKTGKSAARLLQLQGKKGEHERKTEEGEGDEEREGREDSIGRLVWAKLASQHWWPGMVVRGAYCGQRRAKVGVSWIFWFGDHKVSEVRLHGSTQHDGPFFC